jgi:paraquat-inducible protein B
MGTKVSPTVIGAFVVGAAALVVVGVLLFGGGKFFTEKIPYVMFFDGSVQGLNVGAPVVFRGVQVGQVTRVQALYYPKETTIHIKVVIEVVRGVIRLPEGFMLDSQQKTVNLLVEHGLRASLQMQSFVTGLMYINLDFHPGTPVKQLGLDSTYIELPTVPSTTEQMLGTVQQTLAEISKLPLEAVLTELLGVFKRANALLDGPGLTHGLESLDEVTAAATHLLRNADSQVESLGTRASGTAETARATLETARATLETTRAALLDAQKLLRNTEGQVAPLATSAKDTLTAARGVLGQTQKSLSTLTDAAAPALKQGEKAMVSVSGLAAPNSLTLTDLAHTLKALEEAARSIRSLADMLERNPEALLRGKGR